MALRLITATERLAEANLRDTIAIFGPYNIGKTSQVLTLDESSTLFINIEGGMKSIAHWKGAHLDIRTWPDFVDVACLVGGANPAVDYSRLPRDFYSAPRPEKALEILHHCGSEFVFSEMHYNAVVAAYSAEIDRSRFRTLYIDSITDATRLGMLWAQQQPEAFSAKTGARDVRGAYGALGREAIRTLKHFQNSPAKSIIYVGGLVAGRDEFDRPIWEPQMEGGKTARELPFIVDTVLTMDLFDWSAEYGYQHNPARGAFLAFCCHKQNPWGLPAKDRSGQLDLIEEPNLKKIIEKLNLPARQTRKLITAVPGKM